MQLGVMKQHVTGVHFEGLVRKVLQRRSVFSVALGARAQHTPHRVQEANLRVLAIYIRYYSQF